MYYYRIVIDFEHELQRENFSRFFDEIVDSIMDTLDPHEDGSDRCDREMWISGKDVTAEYDRLYNTGMAGFKRDLDDTQGVAEFLESLHFKDYPPPSA